MNQYDDPNFYLQQYGPYLRGANDMVAAAERAYARRRAAKTNWGKRATWKFKGRLRTRARKYSVARQRTVLAPMSRTIDTKYVDLKATISGLKNTAPLVFIVGEVAQGNAESQRVGNDIRVLKYLISIELKHGSSNEDQTFRILLIRAKTNNSNAAVAASDVFESDANGNCTPASLRKVANLEDYEILLDRLVLIKNSYAAQHGIVDKQFMVNVAIGQRYSGSGATTIIRNPVHMMLLTSSTNTTTGASGQYNIRTIYSDVC